MRPTTRQGWLAMSNMMKMQVQKIWEDASQSQSIAAAAKMWSWSLIVNSNYCWLRNSWVLTLEVCVEQLKNLTNSHRASLRRLCNSNRPTEAKNRIYFARKCSISIQKHAEAQRFISANILVAGKYSLISLIWKSTQESTQEKNHSNASMGVGRVSAT